MHVTIATNAAAATIIVPADRFPGRIRLQVGRQIRDPGSGIRNAQ
jgi:hypothetical protein